MSTHREFFNFKFFSRNLQLVNAAAVADPDPQFNRGGYRGGGFGGGFGGGCGK